MIRPPHLRSCLLSATLVVVAVAAWLVVAPTQIGGKTSYVTTSGISMAPRFHSGDLAVVRPTAHYKVGQVVAYRSTLLRTVVLHRIVAIRGDRYVFKGDNNDFVDPVRPVRSELIGRLSLRVAHGGRVLAWLHTPFMAALLCGGAALVLFMGVEGRRRRRDRRRPVGERGTRPVERTTAVRDGDGILGANPQALLVASAAVAVSLAGLAVLAVARPATKQVSAKTPYTEKVSFGYHAEATAGPVYPDGAVKTGDPIFLRLVRRVRVKAHYRLESAAPHRVGGTMEVVLRLTSPTGWRRTMQLAAPKRFQGDYAAADVTLDLPRLRSLIREVDKLTGGSPGAAYNLSVVPRVHMTGTLANGPLTTDFAPAMSLQLDTLQLRPGAASTPAAAGSDTSGDRNAALNPSRAGTVAASTTVPNTLGARGLDVRVTTARWLALIGFVLAGAVAAFTGLRVLDDASDPSARVQRYRHLIVPIAGTTFDPARPPIDVTSIGALAQLAERSERLILHHQHNGADTYLVDDEGTLYRYQAHSHLRQIPAVSVVDNGVYEGAAR